MCIYEVGPRQGANALQKKGTDKGVGFQGSCSVQRLHLFKTWRCHEGQALWLAIFVPSLGTVLEDTPNIFIHPLSLSQYLLSTCYGLGAMTGAEETTENEIAVHFLICEMGLIKLPSREDQIQGSVDR